MNCKKCERYYTTYIDRQLNDKQEELFEKHLESCSHCKDEFARFKKIVSVTVDLPVLQPSSDFDRILQTKLADDEAVTSLRSPYRWNFVYALVVVCLFIAIAGVYVHNFLEHQLDKKQIIANRKIMPMIPVNTDNSIITHFVMPNVPTIQINLPVSNHKNVEEPYGTKDYILPKVIYSSQNERNTDYVLEKVSFTDDNEKGYWR